MLGGNEKAAKRSQVHGVRRKDTDEEVCGWVITYSHSCSIFPRHKNVSSTAKVLIVAGVSFLIKLGTINSFGLESYQLQEGSQFKSQACP